MMSSVAVEGAFAGVEEFLRPPPPRLRPAKEELSFPPRPLFPQIAFPYSSPYLYQPYYHPPAPAAPAALPPQPFKVPPQVTNVHVGSAASVSTSAPKEERTKRVPKKRARAGMSLASFTKGSLVQLASGELRRVEEMTTEDFVSSAEASPALRLDPSTVVRIERLPPTTALLTLVYGPNRSQVEYETSLEQPFFVVGGSWASCSPERTLEKYGLKVGLLQVGDTCISLSPRTDPRKRRWSAPDDASEPPPTRT